MVFSKFLGIDKTPAAGVEINQDYINFVQLGKDDKESTFKLVQMFSIPTPPNTISGGAISDSEAIGKAIRSKLDQLDIQELNIHACVPCNIPFIRSVTLPDLPFEELKVIAQDEAANHIPYAINDANIDLVLLESTRRQDEHKKRIVDVLIIALPKAIAQKYLDMCDSAGLRLKSIDVATYSMIKGLANTGQISPGGDIAVSVLVGYDSTDISLIANGMPLFSHSAAVGKKNIIETISTGVGMSYEETLNFIPEVAILVPGFTATNNPQVVKAATLVRMIYNTISTEISKAIQFYKSQKPDSPEITKIILGGPGMCIQNADKFIANRLKIETELADSFHNITVTPDQLEGSDIPTLISSVGLALKGFKN